MKVLVVDDTTAQRYVRSKVIAASGYTVLEAESGREALDRAQQADVVVLDVSLPGIDGLEVCRTLRADPATATTPIIHVSAVLNSDSHLRGGADAGADAYLVAPVPPTVLIQVIESTLAALRARRTSPTR